MAKKEKQGKSSGKSTTAGARRTSGEQLHGPVTLAEAKALVQAQRPELAKRVVRKGTVPPGSPATIGATRRQIKREQRDEFARRLREYKATMSIMKQRGARAAEPEGARKAKRGAVPRKGKSFVPLQILAEGDSWFDYPAHILKGGIIPRLERRLGVPILNLAKAGDEVRYMLGVEERKLTMEHFRKGCPAGGPWDVMLFSGGGNDIVDNPMALWVRDWDPNATPAGLIHQARYDTALNLVRAGYEDLIELRDRLSPNTHLIFHGYDFALPDDRGVCFMGPWLKPAFDLRGFPSLTARFEVVKVMLQQFAALLTGFAARPKVTFINGQGTLKPVEGSWHNELHPSNKGFDLHADLFYRQLKALFPGRVA